MLRYLGGRLLQAIISILVITTLVFLLVRLTGDPADVLVPDYAPPALQDMVRHQLGLDQPIWVQYLNYMGGLLTFNLGTSFSGQPVAGILMSYIPATATLALASLIVSIGIALPLGILSAMYQGSFIDALARGFALIGQSIPNFWLAIMLILVFAVTLMWFPPAQQTDWRSYVLPAIAMGLAPVAGIVRLTRSSMLEVMASDYIRMARAKGLPVGVIYIKHALRNAIIPVLTFTGLVVAAFLNGSVVIENVFAWPGVGRMMLQSVQTRDFPVVQGSVIVTVVFFIIINFAVDVVYGLVDPRIRLR